MQTKSGGTAKQSKARIVRSKHAILIATANTRVKRSEYESEGSRKTANTLAVGPPVGGTVGTAVGTAVDGTADGVADGEAEGFALGVTDGTAEGAADGCLVRSDAEVGVEIR